MAESETDFPFRKLKGYKYMTIELLMYVQNCKAWDFLHSLSKSTRDFLEKNFIAIENDYFNNGLVINYLGENLNDYENFDIQYANILNKNIGNRVLTITIDAYRFDFKIFNNILKWIKD